MKLYRYSGTVEFAGAVEADSLVEAIRIIDGGLNEVHTIVFDSDDDELSASPVRITRGKVMVEN